MEQCKYPNCKIKAHGTFALVDLCEDHHALIWDETHRFWKRALAMRLQASEQSIRKEYYKIAPLIPWSKWQKEAYHGHH